MKTKNNSLIQKFALVAAGVVTLNAAHAQIFMTNDAGSEIGKYTESGSAISTDFISTGFATGLAFSGGDLYVVDNNSTITGYNIATGAAIGAPLVSDSTGTHQLEGLAASGSNLYVADAESGFTGAAGQIGLYSTDGTVKNASFITGIVNPNDLTVSGNNLFVGTQNGTILEYDATTGTQIGTSPIFTSASGGFIGNMLVSGNTLFFDDQTGGTLDALNLTTDSLTPLASAGDRPSGLAMTSAGDLLVTNYSGSSTQVVEYDASGDVVSTSFIQGGSDFARDIVDVPEPSTYALALAGVGVLFYRLRRLSA